MHRKETPIARFWIAAARSGRAKAADWQAWADDLIAKSDIPDNWLIDLSLAKTVDAIWTALGPRLQMEVSNETEDDDATLGHIWQRYECNEISLAECLLKAGEEADSSSASIECETIYALLNELEASGNEEAVRRKAATLFSHVCKTAVEQWKVLFPDDGLTAGASP